MICRKIHHLNSTKLLSFHSLSADFHRQQSNMPTDHSTNAWHFPRQIRSFLFSPADPANFCSCNFQFCRFVSFFLHPCYFLNLKQHAFQNKYNGGLISGRRNNIIHHSRTKRIWIWIQHFSCISYPKMLFSMRGRRFCHVLYEQGMYRIR